MNSYKIGDEGQIVVISRRSTSDFRQMQHVSDVLAPGWNCRHYKYVWKCVVRNVTHGCIIHMALDPDISLEGYYGPPVHHVNSLELLSRTSALQSVGSSHKRGSQP